MTKQDPLQELECQDCGHEFTHPLPEQQGYTQDGQMVTTSYPYCPKCFGYYVRWTNYVGA